MGNLIFKSTVKTTTKEMKENGHTASEVTKAYNQVSKLAKECGFTEHIQGSAHKTNNGNGVTSLLKLIARKKEIPLFCNYKNRVHFFRPERQADIIKRLINIFILTLIASVHVLL